MSNEHKNPDNDSPEGQMSNEQIAHLLRKIDRAMSGDPYDRDRNPGFIAIMTELHRDYYGDKGTGRMGTKDMVLKLWELRFKIIGGAIALSSGISVIGWIIEQYIQNKH